MRAIRIALIFTFVPCAVAMFVYRSPEAGLFVLAVCWLLQDVTHDFEEEDE